MCGIAGYLNLNKSDFKIDVDLLDKMRSKLYHRGPDSSDIWFSKKYSVGFAHTRLSIIDLSASGSQPMNTLDNSVTVSFNGEIYNHLELRKELENKGYKYFSKTDTETLLHAYKEWGIDFIKKLDGIFAIALFDSDKDRFYLIRDRIGVKPVYYSLQSGVFSFASEIKALFELPWVRKNLSIESVYNYLTFMVTPLPNTIFKDLYKLESGCLILVDSNKKVEVKRWYSPLKNGTSYIKNIRNEKYLIDKIDELLYSSVKKRMISDVPVGAFLSGGIDSSLNVAMMSRFSKNIKTFTVAFADDKASNEMKWARKVSKLFNTEHHEILISEKDAFEFYQNMIYQLDEPLADPVCIPFYFVSKLAKENNIKVVQVGEGADELFFGYPMYISYKNLYNGFWRHSLKFSNQTLRKVLYKLAKYLFSRKSNQLEILKNWSENKFLFWSGAIAFNEYQKNKLLNNINLDSYNCIKSNLELLNDNDDFSKKATFLELKNRLPELLLMRADKMSMLNGIEARVPFLDQQLVEFMLNVPDDLKTKNNVGKYLLKKVAERYLPGEIIYRKKVGFSAPIVNWMLGNGKYFGPYFSSISKKESLVQNIFNKDLEDLSNYYDNHEYGFAI